MNLTKGKISKLYNKKRQSLKKHKKVKSSYKKRTFRNKRNLNLARKSLKKIHYKKYRGGEGDVNDTPKDDVNEIAEQPTSTNPINEIPTITEQPTSTNSINEIPTMTEQPTSTNPINEIPTMTEQPTSTNPINEIPTMTEQPTSTNPINEIPTITKQPTLTNPINEIPTITEQPTSTNPINEIPTMTEQPTSTNPINEIPTMTEQPTSTNSINEIPTITEQPTSTNSINEIPTMTEQPSRFFFDMPTEKMPDNTNVENITTEIPNEQFNVEPLQEQIVTKDDTTNTELIKSLKTISNYIADAVADKITITQPENNIQDGFSSVNKAAETMASSGGSKFKKTRRLRLTKQNRTRHNV